MEVLWKGFDEPVSRDAGSVKCLCSMNVPERNALARSDPSIVRSSFVRWEIGSSRWNETRVSQSTEDETVVVVVVEKVVVVLEGDLRLVVPHTTWAIDRRPVRMEAFDIR